MPKLNCRPPKLCRFKDYAVVYAGGKRICLGHWGTPDAQNAYRRWVAEWGTLQEAALVPKGKATVDDLAIAFLQWSKDNCDHRDYGNYKTALETLLSIYSGQSVESFGVKYLTIIQDQFVLRGYSRGHVNKLTSLLRTVFRWGVSKELVSPNIADALKYVLPLRKGRTVAPETEPRQDVSDSVVEATLPHLLPTIAAMVQVQRAACMRPNEICRMMVGDIDRSDGEVWLYKPGNHKNAWRGHEKAVPLSKLEQSILAPYLEGKKPDNAVFSPRQAIQERIARDAAKRKTKVSPSQIARAKHKAKHPKRIDREFYDAHSYAQSITQSLDAANKRLAKEHQKPIPHWTPYQLRHAAVTENTRSDGFDAARAVAGQKTINVTQRYNHADLNLSIEMAKKRSEAFEKKQAEKQAKQAEPSEKKAG